MGKTDLDWLCESASAEEVKRLMRLVNEWSQGDEGSFPVQLALLTRAQWRAVAKIPPLVDEARVLTELKLTEYRQETAGLIREFATTADAKAQTLSALVSGHTESVNVAIDRVQYHLTCAERVAKRVEEDLQNGAATWKQAKADYHAERLKLEQTRAELKARNGLEDAIVRLLIVLGLIAVGIVIGLRIAGKDILHFPF